MNLKNCFLLVCLGPLLTFSVSAQRAVKIGKGSFAFQGGVNFQSINGKNVSGEKLNSDIFTGYHAGIMADLKIAPGFYFQTGLLYAVKGGKNYLMSSYPTTAIELKTGYLELPLQFVVKPVLGNGHLLLGLGSYVAYGLGGKVKFNFEGIELKKDIVFQNEVASSDPSNEVYLRRMDAGFNMLAGYEFANGIFFQLNTQLGLAKINPRFTESTNDQSLAQNTGFGLTLGYRL